MGEVHVHPLPPGSASEFQCSKYNQRYHLVINSFIGGSSIYDGEEKGDHIVREGIILFLHFTGKPIRGCKNHMDVKCCRGAQISTSWEGEGGKGYFMGAHRSFVLEHHGHKI